MSTIKLPAQRINAQFAASEANLDYRTVPMVWYAGATVLQFSWEDGLHNLTLSMEPKAVKLKQLNSGTAPFTNGHADANDPTATLGVIQQGSVRLDGDKARALVRFSKRADVEPIFQDVIDGVLANVSVGARLNKIKETTQDGDSIKSFVALEWEPYAVALVGLGADPGAHINAAQGEFTECEVELSAIPETAAEVVETQLAASAAQGEVTMPEQNQSGGGTPQNPAVNQEQQLPVATADAQLNAAQQLGVTAEQGRITGILKTGKVCGVGQEFIEKHIALNTSLDTFRALAIDEQARLSAIRIPDVTIGRRPPGDNELIIRRHSMTGALLERFDPGKWLWSDQDKTYLFQKAGGQRMFEPARHYASCTLLDIAKECLTNQGIRWQSKTRTEIAQLAFQSTSDFPFILEDVARKTLRAGYEMSESQWKLIAARRTAADFKTVRELTLDSNSRLEKVPESGEFKRGKLVEGKETWGLSTYGKVIAITRQAIINDDLGAFTRTPQLLGQEVAMLEADLVYGIIKTNGAMRDTEDLFSTAHDNLATAAAAITVDNIGIMRMMMQLQTSPGGKTIGIQPRYLLAPATKGQLAEQYTSANYVAVTAATINPMAGKLIPIIEPRLDVTDDYGTGSTTAWYLFGDPNSPNATVLIYAYLEGQEGPYTETRNGFDVDGVEIKIRHDFGTAAVDFRGAVKNAGA